MRRTMLTSVAALGLALTPAFAQTAHTVRATVEKVDTGAEKITLDHAPIPNLDMGKMKMVFRAGDKAMLTQAKNGDTVLFTADRVNGQLTITPIAKIK